MRIDAGRVVVVDGGGARIFEEVHRGYACLICVEECISLQHMLVGDKFYCSDCGRGWMRTEES